MKAAFRFSPGIVGDHPPGAPPACAGRLVERDRLQWRRGESGDPVELAEIFLAGHGLPVGDLAAPAGPGDHAGGVCGATLLLSAAASAELCRAPAGADSPARSVPDLVVVVWEHGRPAAPEPAGSERGAGPDPGTGWWAGPQRRAGQDPGAGWWVGPWQPSWSPDEHAAAVEHVRAAIADGEVYQVNLVGHTSAPYAGDPLPALRRVTRLPGARYAGVLRGDTWAVACASPETLVRVGAGRVESRPIKGTRPATGPGRVELLASAKERAEHVMIVDLERNDLARVACTGSVRVDELFAVRRWCGLWQAESRVSARLAAGVGLADLLRVVCPGGSVTGAPKLAALRLIAALEPVGRGPSMAALGWVGAGGTDLGLTIRTAAADAGLVHVWAGGGITWASEPSAEVAEAAAKADPLRAALAAASAN